MLYGAHEYDFLTVMNVILKYLIFCVAGVGINEIRAIKDAVI